MTFNVLGKLNGFDNIRIVCLSSEISIQETIITTYIFDY